MPAGQLTIPSTITSVVSLLCNAGILVGVGDFRQEKGKGAFGSFRVLGEGEKDADRLAKLGKRATNPVRRLEKYHHTAHIFRAREPIAPSLRLCWGKSHKHEGLARNAGRRESDRKEGDGGERERAHLHPWWAPGDGDVRLHLPPGYKRSRPCLADRIGAVLEGANDRFPARERTAGARPRRGLAPRVTHAPSGRGSGEDRALRRSAPKRHATP